MKYKIIDNGQTFYSSDKLTALLSFYNREKGAKLLSKPYSIQLFEDGKLIKTSAI